MPDLPDYYIRTYTAWSEIAGLVGGLDANKSADPAIKDVYIATDTKKFYVCYTAGAWKDVTYACLLLAGGTMTGNIAMGGNKVTGLGAPTLANDAARKAYVDLFTLLATFNDHKTRHQNLGDDELNVAGLSGRLADDQHVLDAEAVSAMGAKADVNPLHHDKYSNAEAVSAMGAKADANPLHHDRAAEWGATEHTAIGDAAPHHTKYTNAEAKAAAVQAGAIVDGVTKAPTHDAVYAALEAIEGFGVATITFIIDGGGSAITTGQKGHLEIPFACNITRVTMLADRSGSIVVDIWKDTYALFPPTDGDSITAAAPPTITAAQKSQDSTLPGWATAIAAGDCLAFNVDSVTDIERVTISLKVTKT